MERLGLVMGFLFFIGFQGCASFLGKPDATEKEASRDSCSKGVCVMIRDHGGKTSFRLKSIHEETITVTVKVEMANGTSRPPLKNSEWTQILPGKGEWDLFELLASHPPVRLDYSYRFWWNWGSPKTRHDDRYRYRLPFPSAVSSQVMQGYQGNFSHFDENQYALDFDLPEGTPVLAAREGRVVEVIDHFTKSGIDPCWMDQGNLVIILHSDGTLSKYVHLKAGSAEVRVGDPVKRGQMLALSGNTGYSTAPHLHFEVLARVDGRRQKTVPVKFTALGLESFEPHFGISYVATDE